MKETTDGSILGGIRESEFPAVTARWAADTLEIDLPNSTMSVILNI
jgi:hypothetical protein